MKTYEEYTTDHSCDGDVLKTDMENDGLLSTDLKLGLCCFLCMLHAAAHLLHRKASSLGTRDKGKDEHELGTSFPKMHHWLRLL